MRYNGNTIKRGECVGRAKRISGAAEGMGNRIKRSSPVALTKPERMLLYKYKGTLLQQLDPHSQEIELMTVSVPTRAVIALLYRKCTAR